MTQVNKVAITNRQMIFSLVGILIGIGVLGLPRAVSQDAGPDGWIAILLGSVIPLIAIISTVLLFRRFPGYTFYQISQSILGKYLGKMPLLLYVIYGISFCSIVLRIFGDLLNTYVLPKTPGFVINLLMLIPTLYFVTGGIKVVARYNELSFYLLIPLYLTILPSLKEAEWTFLLPVAATPFTKLLTAALSTSMAFAGFEYLLVLYPFVRKKSAALKDSILAFVMVTTTYIYYTIISIAVFGPYVIRSYIWPGLVLMKTTDVPVIERIEFFFILLWTGVVFRPLMNQYFAVSYLTSQLFGMKEFRTGALFTLPAVLLVSLIPKNIMESFKFSDYVGITSMLVGAAMPVLLILLSIIFKKGGLQNEQNKKA